MNKSGGQTMSYKIYLVEDKRTNFILLSPKRAGKSSPFVWRKGPVAIRATRLMILDIMLPDIDGYRLLSI